MVEPRTVFGNRLAKRLAGKDLLSEFRHCRDYSLLLGKFADDLRLSLMTEGHGQMAQKTDGTNAKQAAQSKLHNEAERVTTAAAWRP